jgi:Ca2+ transporting ATPase
MYPFNSDTKKMTVVIEHQPEQTVRVFTKGAPEILLEGCSHIIDSQG